MCATVPRHLVRAVKDLPNIILSLERIDVNHLYIAAVVVVAIDLVLLMNVKLFVFKKSSLLPLEMPQKRLI